MFDERDDVDDNEPIEEAHTVQIDDVVVENVGFNDAESASVTLKQFLRQNLLILHLSSRAMKHFKKKRNKI